ncbi:MAG: hypothetical protein B6241_00255 [Spirochaetaceae bacterium 4572_59]|nr:MAG: hypothetical protein B6241_00255 [Spirochaetaceae bacterium 4572_59]
MKRNLIIIGSLLMIFAMMAGCASTASEPEQRRDLPEWYLNPPVAEDVIYGLGQAKMSTDSLSRDTAISRARTDIAKQVNTRVQNVMTDYAQQAGEGENAQFISMVETITKQISDVELKGAVTEKVYAAVDGNWYAMVSYPKTEITDAVEDIFVRNEEAAFAEFKSDQALKMLEESIANDPLKSEEAGN